MRIETTRLPTNTSDSHFPALHASFLHTIIMLIIINIRGQIENRPLENTRFAGRK